MDFASLQHSVFLQAIGSAILNSLWQTLLLWLLYETILVSYKNSSARFKNNLSTILLFLSFVLFLSNFISNVISHRTAMPIETLAVGTAQLPAVDASSTITRFLSYAGSALPYLSMAYILLLLILTARLLTAYRYVYIISKKRLLSPPAELEYFANRVSIKMGIARKISIWISQHIDVPATIGFIKPVILIPFASLNNLSGDQLEAIILHELSHIKRNDYIINIIVAAIETVLFFNPFVVLLAKVIKRERENCCDDFVLQYRYDPHSYAAALLRLEQSRATNLKLAVGAVSGKKQLLSRIKRITNGHVVSRQFNYGQKLLALLLITAIICSVAWLSPGAKKQSSDKISEIREEIKRSPKTDVVKATNLPNSQNYIFSQIIVKHTLPKKTLAPFREESVARDLLSEKGDDDPNQDITIGYPENAPLALNINTPQFFFDTSKLKLPPSIKIKNFPFQNADFDIDLSKIDLNKLNENLQQAYKEINNINWADVQKDIRESFSKMKFAKLPSKEQVDLILEKSKELSKMRDEKLRSAMRSLAEKQDREIQLQDSLNTRKMILVYHNDVRILQQYQRAQNRYTESTNNNSYGVNYSTNEPYEGNAGYNTVICVSGNNKASTMTTRNLKISSDKITPRNLHQKKFIQFSFDSDTKKPNSENIINVEVNDLP